MALQRQLGGMERQFLHHNTTGSTNFCSILFVEGTLDRAALPEALASVLKTYPQLTAKFSQTPKQHYLLAGGESRIPFRVLERSDDNHWRTVVEQEILRHYDNERIFVTLLEGKDKCELIISLDHTLSDGKSGHSIAGCLVSALRGEKRPEETFGESLEVRYPKYFKGWRGLFRALHFLWKRSRIVPHRSFRFGDLTPTRHTFTAGLSLDQETTRALKDQAVSHASNINAAICAASMLTSFELISKVEEGTIALNTPVSLRSQIEPPATPTELGMFISGFLSWHTVTKHTDVWQLARNTLAAIREGLKAGEAIMLGTLVGGRKGPPVDRKPRQFSPSMSVTNLGNLEAFPDLPGGRIVNYRTLVSIWPQDSITIVVLTYDGRLVIDVHTSAQKFCEEGHITQRLATALKSRLESMARTGA